MCASVCSFTFGQRRGIGRWYNSGIHTVVIKPAKNKTQNKRFRRHGLGLLLLRYSYDKHSHCLQSTKQNEHKMLLSSIEVSLLHVYRLQESTKLFVTTFLADEPLPLVLYPFHDSPCSLITAWKRKSKTFSSLRTTWTFTDPVNGVNSH